MRLKKLKQIFDVRYGHSLELNRLRLASKTAGIPFVSRKMGDNGIAAYVEEIDSVAPYPAGELTCALSGNGVLSTFIQDQPYYTGFHVACLRPKTPLSKGALLYYCECIRSNRYRYSWGRQANRTIGNLLLPALEELPRWVDNADVDMFKGADTPYSDSTVPLRDVNLWVSYLLKQLFEIKKGKRLTKVKMVDGSTPYIGAIDSNNGVSAYVGQDPIHDGNTITVNYNGSVGEAFYQPIPFWATDDANVLYPRFELTPSIALFICTIIRLEKYRFNYGRKWHKERMEESCIRLPADSSGTPDWDYS